jgi:hypothetical protein
MNIYPEHNWQFWRFDTVPHKMWKDQKSLRQFFDWLAKELNVVDLKDWYKISKGEVIKR